MRVFFPVSFKAKLSFRRVDQIREKNVEKWEIKRDTGKKEKVISRGNKKARAENVTLKRELH